MKRILSIVLVIAMLFSLTACASGEKAEKGETYKAALLLNGNLGDKSFFDSANEGLTKLDRKSVVRERVSDDIFCRGGWAGD